MESTGPVRLVSHTTNRPQNQEEQFVEDGRRAANTHYESSHDPRSLAMCAADRL